DEPSTGLDPQARLFVHDRVANLREQGVTVVLTTHDMDEAAKLCDRVGIVDHGKLLALDTPSALTRELPGSATLSLTIERSHRSDAEIDAALGTVTGVQRVEHVLAQAAPGQPGMAAPGQQRGAPGAPSSTSRLRLYVTDEPAVILPMAVKLLQDMGCGISDLSIGTPSLEDVFIHLTGRELR
ncbi:MAG: ABC transporter ATP-binding protein, partial [Sciscionella sp.]